MTTEERTEEIELFYNSLGRLIGFKGAQILKVTSFQYLLEKLKVEYEEVEKHLSILDELYEFIFKLLTIPQGEKPPD